MTMMNNQTTQLTWHSGGTTIVYGKPIRIFEEHGRHYVLYEPIDDEPTSILTLASIDDEDGEYLGSLRDKFGELHYYDIGYGK